MIQNVSATSRIIGQLRSNDGNTFTQKVRLLSRYRWHRLNLHAIVLGAFDWLKPMLQLEVLV